MEEQKTPEGGTLIPIAIEDEMKKAYIDYSMSVIISRALPDVRDGLKPVHRRILYSMEEMGLRHNTQTKKCARIVGDVLGKYHPHGDGSVYDALVRLAQDFSLRYPVIFGQGNFGSVDGDPPAAYRYTEAKLSKVSEYILDGIKKETVDFVPNFDDSLEEPSVLPGAFPFLLANGSSGIAVGMATNMPPHNLREIAAAVTEYIENAECSIDDLMKHVKGPDFPTGGVIFGRKGIKHAYRTGRGRIIMRGRFAIEVDKRGKESIIFTEIPYQVNKAKLIERIAALMREKTIDGISDVNDESDREGMRIVIDLKRGAVVKLVLNQLFTHTALQSTFGVINLALVKGRPQVLTLKDLIANFVEHRQEVVTRRIQFDLRKAEERAHILRGLIIAIQNIDEVIKIIKASRDIATAKNALMERFTLSEIQAQAIVDMRLGRLTSLEIEKLEAELAELEALIAYLKDLLEHPEKILKIIKEETDEIAGKFGDDRKTDIISDEIEELNIEDLIKKEEMVVLISNLGYIKRVPVSAYKRQGRGGKGINSAKLVEDDFINQIFIASTHDNVMFITNEGKGYWVKVHEIPESSKNARGAHIKSLLTVNPNEEITTVVTLKEFSEDQYLFMATAAGVVKKVQTTEFQNAKTRGIIAIRLDDGDKLATAILTKGEGDLVLITRRGKGLRIDENDVRPMGRSARGVKGISLANEDELAGALEVKEGLKMLLVTEFGFGKRTDYDEFSPHGRGTGGQKIFNVSDKTGEIVGCVAVSDSDEAVCITSQGKTLRVVAETIRESSRSAGGVKVLNIDSPDMVIGLDKIAKETDSEEDESKSSANEAAGSEAETQESASDEIETTETNVSDESVDSAE